jgi:AraC-like DNA-binding protein
MYEVGFDEYLHFPITPQQAYYRFKSLISNPSRCHKANYSDVEIYNTKNFKLAKLCSEYLLENISDTHTLASIANTLGTNRNSLSIAFKDIHNIGVFTWLRQQRLLEARRLLCNSDQHIQNIAYELGFSDPSNFTNAYKLEFGLSPSETRQLLIITESGEPFKLDIKNK